MPPSRRGTGQKGRRIPPDRSAAGRALPPESLLALASVYPASPAAFVHDLGDDPIFSPPRLMTLAATLPGSAFHDQSGALLSSPAAAIQALVTHRTGPGILIDGLHRDPGIAELALAQMRPIEPFAAASRAEPEDLSVSLTLLGPGQSLPGASSRHRLLLAGRGAARVGEPFSLTARSGTGLYVPPGHALSVVADQDDVMWWLCLEWNSPWARLRTEEAAFLTWTEKTPLGAAVRSLVRPRSLRARIGRLLGKV